MTNETHTCSVVNCQGTARFNLAASLAYPSLYVCSVCWHEMVANGENFEQHNARRAAGESTTIVDAYSLRNALIQRDARGGRSYGYDLPQDVREALTCWNCGGGFRYGSQITISEKTATVRHNRCDAQDLRQSAPQAQAQRHTWRD